MKKITLILAFSLVSLIGFAQESNSITNSASESLKRHSEYIIVLDDTVVDGNIDILLNDSVVTDEVNLNFNNHELVHDAHQSLDIESKFIEGAFTYNEYALYTMDLNDINGLKS